MPCPAKSIIFGLRLQALTPAPPQHLRRLAAAIAASCCCKRSIFALWRAVTVVATRRAPHSQFGMLDFATLPRVIAVADSSLATSPTATLSSTQLILSYFAGSKDAWKADAQPPTNTRLHIRAVAVEMAFILSSRFDAGRANEACEPLQHSDLGVIPLFSLEEFRESRCGLVRVLFWKEVPARNGTSFNSVGPLPPNSQRSAFLRIPGFQAALATPQCEERTLDATTVLEAALEFSSIARYGSCGH